MIFNTGYLVAPYNVVVRTVDDNTFIIVLVKYRNPWTK